MSSQEMHGKEEGSRYLRVAGENDKRKRLHMVRRNQIDTLVLLCLDSVKIDFVSGPRSPLAEGGAFLRRVSPDPPEKASEVLIFIGIAFGMDISDTFLI